MGYIERRKDDKMEPFRPEQIVYLKKLIYEASNYVVANHGLQHISEFLDKLPKYFCQNQTWYRKIRDGKTGSESSGMVCLKYNAVCNVTAKDASNCCDYLSFEQIEKCEDGICKI